MLRCVRTGGETAYRPLLIALLQKTVAVHPLSPHGNKQRVLGDLARIDYDRSDLLSTELAPHLSFQYLTDLLTGYLSHAFPPSNAFSTSSTSSKWIFSRPII